jgi:hypothetical protein
MAAMSIIPPTEDGIDRDALVEVCIRFIEDNKISCPETIAQCDRVMENAYEFIEKVCLVVGYYEY